MRYCFLIFFGALLLSCNRRKDDDQTKLNLEYLEKEIADRELLLKKDSAFSFRVDSIQTDVFRLQMLTIDVENLQAAIIRSNKYFSQASSRFGVDTSGFVMMYRGVPLHDMLSMIKKNHLNLLNKIIIKENKNGRLMYTAQ
jgi:hypothetical protein